MSIKHLSTLALLGLVLSCSGKEPSAPPPPAPPALSLELIGALDVADVDKAQMLAEISKIKSGGNTSEEERRFLDHFQNEVSTWEDLSRDGEPQKRATSLLSVLRMLILAGPRDFEAQLQGASKLLVLSYAMQNLNMDYKPVREEAIRATRSLVSRFPKQDRAYAQLGHVLLTEDETQAQAARAHFETCLKLNASNTYCRDYLSRLASR